MPMSSVHQLTQTDLDYLKSLPSSEFDSFVAKIAAQDEDLAASILFVVGSRQVADKQTMCAFFGVAPETIDLWARKGMPSEAKVGGESRYDPARCAQWLARQKGQVTADDQERKVANDYREEKRRIAELQRRKMEGELFELRHLEERLATVKVAIRKGLDQIQKAFGDEVVVELGRIIDDAIGAINVDGSE